MRRVLPSQAVELRGKELFFRLAALQPPNFKRVRQCFAG